MNLNDIKFNNSKKNEDIHTSGRRSSNWESRTRRTTTVAIISATVTRAVSSQKLMACPVALSHDVFLWVAGKESGYIKESGFFKGIVGGSRAELKPCSVGREEARK